MDPARLLLFIRLNLLTLRRMWTGNYYFQAWEFLVSERSNNSFNFIFLQFSLELSFLDSEVSHQYVKP